MEAEDELEDDWGECECGHRGGEHKDSGACRRCHCMEFVPEDAVEDEEDGER